MILASYNPQEALKQYRQLGIESEVNTASSHRLIQMLFEGAISKLAAAQGALDRGDLATKGEALSRAISIIAGLRSSLDLSTGEIAENLDRLYEYMNIRLLEASAQKDSQKIAEVSQLLKTLKSGWDEITPVH
ncbi:MAG: flagellar export chaperone FliS [Cellvibrio sp.]|jgi:flagellar protein FliS|nr:flagellar export chaperone FliS [Cellvibrio sp.]